MNAATEDILGAFPGCEPLAGGGQKAVFVWDHPEHGPVVVKIGAASSPQSMERIRREVQVLQELNSPYYPTALGLREFDDGHFVTIEERIAADSLAEVVGEYQDEAGATWVLREVAAGLQELWGRRIVHRDIKPANLLVDGRQRLWIIDLGIARLLDETTVTLAYAPRGPCTPGYAAPEQVGNRRLEINHRADQFSIGVTVAQLLLGGVHPFDPRVVGSGESLVDNAFNGNWAREQVRVRISRELFTILERLMQTRAHRRYRTPAHLFDALDSLGG